MWSAIQQAKPTFAKTDVSTEPLKELPQMWYPNRAYGWDSIPYANNYFIKDITIWTCDSNGTYVGDVWIENGRITAVGKELEQPNDAVVISGKGKHLTPGLVDEHSHIGISRGVNEGTYNSSAMVRNGDVVNPTDINIYRQLAGGVTTAQLLHGSANPIGGQSALVKLKWGSNAEQMKIENAPGFIKFALGENVKQSNWGDYNRIRYPQTRRGVAQLYYHKFYHARD